MSNFGQNVDTSEWSDVGVQLKNVRFGSHQSYKDNDGNMPVVMLADLVNDSGSTREDQVFSIGGGYKAIDGGTEITHTRAKYNKGENLGFSRNSKGAVLLDSLAALDVDKLIERAAEVDGGPRTARFWEGITFHLVEEEIEFGKPDEDGKRRTYRQPKATALYGWNVDFPAEDGEDEVAAVVNSHLPTKPATKAVKTAADFGLAEDTFETLATLARGAEDYETFVEAAYNLDIIAEEAVQVAVDDDVNGIYGNV